MSNPKAPDIIIEKINLVRSSEFLDVLDESGRAWFEWGMIPKPDLSYEELRFMIKAFLLLWESDDTYMFYTIDRKSNQIVGAAFLNRMNRMRQFANLGYATRMSRTKEGIATAAAKLAVTFGFEKLELQRIEIVVHIENIPSQRVAEKLCAVREGLLRNGLRLHGRPCNAYLYSLIPTDLCISKIPLWDEKEIKDEHNLDVFFHRILVN